ncbi:MAG TPA: rhomboid family intramembrane serine protease [Solirubrobacterales bacterium]|nr:rhomboid family intramembrane serine protease [Solirubrobacterales bacterium]
MSSTETQTCYRHPDRETRVSCSSCGRPICPECMTPTPVGMRCPECSRQRTKVVRNPTGTPGQASAFPATVALIAINVIVYLIEIAGGGGGINNPSGRIIEDFGLYGPFVHEGEIYRLVTAGFLHASLFHIGFNMLLLFFLGRLLEPALGTTRFLVLYFASLLAGSLGALILEPNSLGIGASGAIFGLAGATFVIARGRGMEALAGQIGFLIIFNLIFSFSARNVSIGAHVGGLIGGVICALAIVAGEKGMFGRNRLPLELAAMVAVGVLAFLASLAVA